MTHSIHTRIILSAFIVLVLFMSLTGILLDNAFRNNAIKSQQENLRTQIYTLLATAELDDDNTLQLPEEITEPRLNITESNLHARVITTDKNIIWRSKSILNTNLAVAEEMLPGKFYFSEFSLKNQSYTLVNFSTQWVNETGEQTYIFQVAENRNILNTQVNNFRKSLWSWLVAVSFLLIIIQTFILRWGLTPLRHVAEDLITIEKGHANKLSGQYPKEITPLTNNLNQLLDSSQQQLTRYRDALGNMAHSLKTPIAVLQGIINTTTSSDKNIAAEQIATINNIVEYQLQRAATAGRLQATESIHLELVTEKIINTLLKVHNEKNITSQINMPEKLMLKIDQGDLYELLGNLLENAFKWCNKKILVTAEKINEQTQIIIEDDGPGISIEERERILLRGQRADQNTPGHGLGLAMVNNILLLYKGSIKIADSDLGGAKIIITL